MFKKLLVICAPVIVFFVFLTVFVLFSGSKSPDKTPGAAHTSDADETEKETSSNFWENPTESAETTAQAAEIDVAEIDMVYNAPYSPEKIKSIFEQDKKLFEKIKDMTMPKGCNYLYAARPGDPSLPYKIEFYSFDGLGNADPLAYDIGESGDYSEIYELFKKYEYISFIHAIDPESEEYAEANLIAQFGLVIDVPVSSDHVAWAEIRYNRIAGEIEEKMTNEYMTVPLDGNWYYIYSNIY